MKPVGIIANPASGKDIRRLVAFGSVFDNHEKVNIVRRVLLGLDSAGVREVFIMPDYFGIGPRALEDLGVSLEVAYLQLEMEGTQDDSTKAAAALQKMGAGCIVTLGGDGTNRAVAKACADVPLLPISTGTNNVFPSMVEGTLAGIAAGVVALDWDASERLTTRAPRLEVWRGAELLDIALVDVVVSSSGFIASRAVWEVSTLREIFLARAEPENIGFSSVGGRLHVLPRGNGQGMYIVIGEGGHRVKAPIAPGLIPWVPVQSYRVFEAGEAVPIRHTPSAIALDGEREHIAREREELAVRLERQGPRVVDIGKALRRASEERLFLAPQ